MDRTQTFNKLKDTGIIAVIRVENRKYLLNVIEAIYKAGVTCIEITMSIPDALNVITELCQNLPEDMIVGVGSVIDSTTARMAINAGAEFVVSPILDEEIIQTSHRYDKLCIPGGFTPTEILHAWQAGADVVKVFPASSIGPTFLKDIKGPLPQIKLTPTGGVNLDTATEFLAAGAEFLGVGSALLNKQAISEQNWSKLTKIASQFITQITEFQRSSSLSSNPKT